MGPTQGIQGHQAIQTLNNDIYDSTGGNNSSSYISSSGIKSVLLNAWNAVKSAISGMLSSFGLHLSGQQGSDKPGREIVMDMSSRPAQPLPGMDAQLENSIYESCDGNIYDSVYAAVSERPESLYACVDDDAFVREPAAPPVPGSPRPSLSESLYSEIEEPLYAEIGEGQDQTPPPVNLSTHPSLSRLYDSEAGSQVTGSGDDIYAKPHQPGNTVSTPENDPRGESDYDIPWKSQPDEQLQQRRTLERLNTL
ncbi:hypothetical protein F9883_05760 [Morganella morganii]|uniref:hypothetical protein n=1 Tax=Morganella morganii TaxID=582 RepID=UPI0015F739C4|nr:hypothetical protein [Morganella morganii]MBA5807390.1 hypothetical protein [Morganella morganii]